MCSGGVDQMFPCYWIHLHVVHQGSSIFELSVCRSSKKSSIFSIASLMSTIGQRFSPSRSVCALFYYPKEAVQKSRLLQSMRFCFSETVLSAKSVGVFQTRGTKTCSSRKVKFNIDYPTSVASTPLSRCVREIRSTTE
ncbi:hypothetical protein Tsp_14660 [Trichinella spiralis]|uniref:hypothetical protein n=1 Tax=Trichinella spiralis TaxID=6334 RepID=UPI0001EFD473|nr:hypothetical protein Tsp_14660 [Trichinella spiralis]